MTPNKMMRSQQVPIILGGFNLKVRDVYGECLVKKHLEVEVQLCTIHQGSLKYQFFLGESNNTNLG